MDTTTARPSLLALREQLLGVLANLDALGEHIAAAHLLAAIDTLEDRVGLAQVRAAEPASPRPLDAISHGMMARFGDRAPVVARDQLAASSGDAIAAWACIVERIESLGATPTAGVPATTAAG